MSLIAIVGAGPVGSALAHKLAGRGRVAAVRLIDDNESVARGKALDIVQAGPVDGFGTNVSADASIHAAAGADVIVFADDVAGAEHSGETGLALVRRLIASGSTAPFVFAGTLQRELMTRCITELRIASPRVIGSAPFALASAVRALSAVVLDTSAVEISLNVLGVPPRQAVVTWQEGSVAGQPLQDVMGAHEIAALAARVPSLWPPGPYALASAAARVTEAVCCGSRRQYSCFVDVGRGRIAAMPVELHRGGVKRVLEPALTTLERTALQNSLEDA
jgi:malate dehydrogenase